MSGRPKECTKLRLNAEQKEPGVAQGGLTVKTVCSAKSPELRAAKVKCLD